MFRPASPGGPQSPSRGAPGADRGHGEVHNLNSTSSMAFDADYTIRMIWRDLYFRKLIPDALYCVGEGAIDQIFAAYMS